MIAQLLVTANWRRGDKCIPASRLCELLRDADTLAEVGMVPGADGKYDERPIISRTTTGRVPLYGKEVDAMLENGGGDFLKNGFAAADSADAFIKSFEPDEKEWVPIS